MKEDAVLPRTKGSKNLTDDERIAAMVKGELG